MVGEKRKTTSDTVKNVRDFWMYWTAPGLTNRTRLVAIVDAGYKTEVTDLESFLSTFASVTRGGGNVQEAVKSALGVKTATAAKLLNYYNKIK